MSGKSSLGSGKALGKEKGRKAREGRGLSAGKRAGIAARKERVAELDRPKSRAKHSPEAPIQ